MGSCSDTDIDPPRISLTVLIAMFQPQYCQCSSGNEVKSTLVRHYWCDLARRRR